MRPLNTSGDRELVTPQLHLSSNNGMFLETKCFWCGIWWFLGMIFPDRTQNALHGNRGPARIRGAATTEYAILLVALLLIALVAQQLGNEINRRFGQATWMLASIGGGTESTTGGGTIICEYRRDDSGQCFARCYEEGNYQNSREVPIRCSAVPTDEGTRADPPANSPNNPPETPPPGPTNSGSTGPEQK